MTKTKTKAKAPSAVEVLDVAIEKLSRPDGYVMDTYHGFFREKVEVEGNVPDYVSAGFQGGVRATVETAGAHCAVGGVEHAIWKVCHANVTAYRPSVVYNSYHPVLLEEEGLPVRLYGEVMAELNAVVSRDKECRAAGTENIEEATTTFDKPKVMELFRRARRNLARRQG